MPPAHENRLDPRLVSLQRTVGWITWACVSLPLFSLAVVLTLAGPGTPGGAAPVWILVLLVSGALAFAAQAWPPMAYRRASYAIDDSGIEIRRGVLWRRVVNVARSRVQHTDVAQGPLERRYGLATLLIYTAGTLHAQVDLFGLDHATALRIRDHLLPGTADDAV